MKNKFILIVLSLFFLTLSYSQDNKKIEMVLVKGGTFTMGNDYGGKQSQDEKPEHEVTLADYYISKYEISFKEYDTFCKTTSAAKPDDAGMGRANRPVINVSWVDAVKYCNWLSRKDGLKKCYKIDSIYVKCDFTQTGYRLPTEAEWEYAANGGEHNSTFAFSGANEVDSVAWHSGNSDGKTHDIGSKTPNALGVFDMTGNAPEWCWDKYRKDYYKESEKSDPKGSKTGTRRVHRGGHWNMGEKFLRITKRHFASPTKLDRAETKQSIGIRIARKK